MFTFFRLVILPSTCIPQAASHPKHDRHLANLQSYRVSQHMPLLCIICLGGEAVQVDDQLARLVQAGRPLTQAEFWFQCFAVVQAVKP